MFYIKLILFSLIFFNAFNLQAQPKNNVKTEELTYLLWDNETLADNEDLLSDPLLVLRASVRYSDGKDTLKEACQRVAKLNFFTSSEDNQLTHSLKNSFFNQELHETNDQPLIQISNTQYDFKFSKPFFSLNCNDQCEQVWWQLSSYSDFSSVISTFERINSFNDFITLTDLEETFLESDHTYYFRIRGKNESGWGPWSKTFSFTTSKPQPLEDFYFESSDQSISKLFWETNATNCTYLIFGSNSIDFIPSIYSSQQPETILEDTVVSFSETNNFLGETQENSISLPQRFAYYRVIAKFNDRLSKPSKLIPICDGFLSPDRDVLQYDKEGLNFITRHQFAPGYQWMQKKASKEAVSTQYVRNPYVSEEIWNMLSPYFLPENFPEKAALDRIFSQRRVLSSIKSMYKSGFNLITDPKDKIIVAKHPYLKGYLIKAYTDEMDAPEWYWWKRRIDGIRSIQEKIIQYGYQGIMKTPKKWIYPLPPEPSPKIETPKRKNFILVVQEMDILNYKKNRKAYKTKMTPQILDAYYIILTELLLIDSIYADNTPFCKDGKLAFIDTEHSHDTTRPVPLSTVAHYLSPAMHVYWEQLIVNGGPPR